MTSVDTTGWGSANANGLSGGDSGISGEWTGYRYEPFGEDCHEVPVDAGGSGQVEVQVPTSVITDLQYYVYQVPGDYDRRRVYKVKDQNDQIISRAGLGVTESSGAYLPNTNACNFDPPRIDTAFTDAFGQFSDSYNLQRAPACAATPTPSCLATAIQTIRVAGRVVQTNTVSWTCSRGFRKFWPRNSGMGLFT